MQKIGNNVRISPTAKINCKNLIIGDNCEIRDGVDIEVTERFEIGKNSIIGKDTIIHGRDIQIGREFYSNHHAEIGGGSCQETLSSLKIGYWFHMGSYSMINTARQVIIGNEVGIGRFTNIYTHGAYLSCIEGFPVKFAPVRIGNKVWIPNATVMPGVTIGNNVVIGANSLVTRDVPNNCIALGIPARPKDFLSQKLPRIEVKEQEKMIEEILGELNTIWSKIDDLTYRIDNAYFHFDLMVIEGEVTKISEKARNLLRRHGIRFAVDTESGKYTMWG
ncbi:hypothetical protein [Sulfuricurvum sp.]|uniref:hypothetical protein n=1 Tax=Sulfuricurvum sp. TaxID=2025608 RepID=UPI003565498F